MIKKQLKIMKFQIQLGETAGGSDFKIRMVKRDPKHPGKQLKYKPEKEPMGFSKKEWDDYIGQVILGKGNLLLLKYFF